jgi:hypothetical protein
MGACHLCENTGEVPVFSSKNIEVPPDACCVADETDPELMRLWEAAEQGRHAEDGWHMITPCPGCGRKAAGP